MARPSEQPEWADGGSAVRADPTSGKKAIGWVRKEKPAAEILNWWQYTVFLWIQWLAAGILDGNWEFTGNVQVDGTTTLDDNVTVASNKNITLQGTGKVKRGTRVRHFSVYTGKSIGSGTFPTSSGHGTGAWHPTTGGDLLEVPLVVEENERITDIKVQVYSDTGCRLDCSLWSVDDAFSVAQRISEIKSSSTGGNTSQTLDIAHDTGGTNALAVDVINDTLAYFVAVEAVGNPAGSGPFVTTVSVTTTVP